MTYIISNEVLPLLQPTAFFRADDVALHPSVVPNLPGLYGWWFDGAVPEIPRERTLETDGRRLLYVGIAPSGARGTSGKRTLRDRLKNHCRGPIAQSTVRRTLVCLLNDSLDLRPMRTASGKLAISRSQELELTAWMGEHLRVAWMAHPEPWDIERALIVAGSPRLPLNIAGSGDPFTGSLKARRSLLLAGAS